MRGTSIRTLVIPWLSIGFLSIAVACKSTPTISFDARGSWSSYHTWDWLPYSTPTTDAPNPYLIRLNRERARFVARELEERGFVARLPARSRRTRIGDDSLDRVTIEVDPQAPGGERCHVGTVQSMVEVGEPAHGDDAWVKTPWARDGASASS